MSKVSSNSVLKALLRQTLLDLCCAMIRTALETGSIEDTRDYGDWLGWRTNSYTVELINCQIGAWKI